MDSEEYQSGKVKTKQVYEKLKHKNYSKKVELTPRDCTRFNENYKDITTSNALMYLKLRSEKCNMKDALTFSGKTYCRIDSTTQKFGPPNMRVLKPSSSMPKVTHNVGIDD